MRKNKSVVFMSEVSSEGVKNVKIHGWSSLSFFHFPNILKASALGEMLLALLENSHHIDVASMKWLANDLAKSKTF